MQAKDNVNQTFGYLFADTSPTGILYIIRIKKISINVYLELLRRLQAYTMASEKDDVEIRRRLTTSSSNEEDNENKKNTDGQVQLSKQVGSHLCKFLIIARFTQSFKDLFFLSNA